jgi:hypothetical protein
MTRDINIVVFKPFNKTHINHTKEYMVIVDPAEVSLSCDLS